jgi:hypothetical protein
MKARWKLGIAVALAIAAHLSSQPTWAQTRSSQSTTGASSPGLFGQNTVGSSSNFNAPSGSTGGGGGSSSGGSGSLNAQDPFAQQNIASQSRAPTIQTTQQRGAFVGADSSDSTNARSLQGTNARSQFGNNGLAQLQNLFQQGMQNINQGNQQGAQVKIPVSLKLGFAPQPVSPVRVQAFETRFTKLPSVRFIGPSSVTLEGRTAVLRGMVASAEARELAEALAMMEPDVLNVRNELTVDSTATTPEAIPTVPATAPR